MPAQKAESATFQVERRSAVRFSFEAAAQLKTPSGIKLGKISDISQSGARIEINDPPTQGASVLLSWDQHEEFCRVMWIADGSCGVQFERQIPSAIVLQTTGPGEEIDAGPIANRDNIPAGRKRQRLGSSG